MGGETCHGSGPLNWDRSIMGGEEKNPRGAYTCVNRRGWIFPKLDIFENCSWVYLYYTTQISSKTATLAYFKKNSINEFYSRVYQITKSGQIMAPHILFQLVTKTS